MRYPVRHPDKAYVTNNLLLPRRFVNESVIKAALTFIHGEELIVDEAGEVIGSRPRPLYLWDETATHLIVPREFLHFGDRLNFDFEFVHEEPGAYPTIKVKDRIELRDSAQKEAFNALLRFHSGTLNLSCGKGKTILALKLIAHEKVPALIVVNTTALLEQWKERIKDFLGVEAGIMQADTRDWEGRDVVVGMVHTLSNLRPTLSLEFQRKFGLVFYDEGHHMSAPVFVKSADMCLGRRFSLTATADRTDGLEAIYQYHLGRVIYSDLTQDLVPDTIFRRMKWSLPEWDNKRVTDSSGMISMPRVRSYLGKVTWRNHVISGDIRKDLSAGRQILVLSHSVDHVTVLAGLAEELGKNVGVITGKTDQQERLGILKKCNPVIGTFQLAREGLDKPSLDTLYVTTPFSNSNDLQQSWGRIQRVAEGKQHPLVRVYEDLAFECCRKACNNLRGFLRRLSYPFKTTSVKLDA